MIIVRQKGARKLAYSAGLRAENIYFANKILYAQSIDIIYLEEGKLFYRTFYKEKMKVYKLIGELERNDVAFILLVNKKCEIFTEGKYITVVNSNCVSTDLLQSYFDKKDRKENNKDKMFNLLFKEWLGENYFDSKYSFAECFDYFLKTARQEDVLVQDTLFLAISDEEEGFIFNANKRLGKTYDKIWYFGEEYDYDPKQVDIQQAKSSITPTNRLEEFCLMYETSCYTNTDRISKLTEDELTEIVIKYPVLFRDFASRGHSYYSASYNNYVRKHPEEFTIEVEEEEDEEDIFEEYYNEVKEAPKGMTMCYGCENFVPINQTAKMLTDGKEVDICDDCTCAFNWKKAEDRPKKRATLPVTITPYGDKLCENAYKPCFNVLLRNEEIYCRGCLIDLRDRHEKCTECGKEELWNAEEIWTTKCESCLKQLSESVPAELLEAERKGMREHIYD